MGLKNTFHQILPAGEQKSGQTTAAAARKLSELHYACGRSLPGAINVLSGHGGSHPNRKPSLRSAVLRTIRVLQRRAEHVEARATLSMCMTLCSGRTPILSRSTTHWSEIWWNRLRKRESTPLSSHMAKPVRGRHSRCKGAIVTRAALESYT